MSISVHVLVHLALIILYNLERPTCKDTPSTQQDQSTAASSTPATWASGDVSLHTAQLVTSGRFSYVHALQTQ